MTYILWFHEVGREHVAQVGGKGANLGEMASARMPVPPGTMVWSGFPRTVLRINTIVSAPITQLSGCLSDISFALPSANFLA